MVSTVSQSVSQSIDQSVTTSTHTHTHTHTPYTGWESNHGLLPPPSSLPPSLTHSLTQQQEGCGVEWSHLNSLPDAALLCIYAFYSILPTQSFSASSIVLYSFAGRYATVPLQYCQLVTPPSPMLVHSLTHSFIH